MNARILLLLALTTTAAGLAVVEGRRSYLNPPAT